MENFDCLSSGELELKCHDFWGAH